MIAGFNQAVEQISRVQDGWDRRQRRRDGLAETQQEEVFSRTSISEAPWYAVEANDKNEPD